jgi:hypothetical protein
MIASVAPGNISIAMETHCKPWFILMTVKVFLSAWAGDVNDAPSFQGINDVHITR